MSHNKLTPRQKMISMMYLVLTAMLAMNVSKEVLNAFVVVNEGIENSNELINTKNQELYSKLFKELNTNANEKTKEIEKLVFETQKITNESIEYINVIKNEILNASGLNENKESKILFAKLDDLETGTRIMTEFKEGSKSNGELLREELSQIQSKFLDVIEKGNPTEKNTEDYKDYRNIYSRKLTLRSPSKNTISLEGKSMTWSNKNFLNVPVVATDVILTKLQNDIYSSEAEVLDYLLKQINADIPLFDELSAAVISPKSYLPAGKVFEADIFIAASSSQQQTEVFIGKLDKAKFEKENGALSKTHVNNDQLFFLSEYKKVPIKNGKAKFERLTSGVGVKNYEGIIRVKKPTGGFDLYPFNFDYEVAPKSGFSVSPTAMNVLYIGLDNPLSITVSGSKDSDVQASISTGSVIRRGNEWFAKVSQQGNASVEVFGVIDGERKKIGTQEFRVKRIPDPVSTIDGKVYSNNISKARLKSHKAIIPYLKDFVYNVKFSIISYDFLLKHGSEIITVKNNGTYFNEQVKQLINNSKKKDMVFFQNIMVKGPDGNNRKINPIILTIK